MKKIKFEFEVGKECFLIIGAFLLVSMLFFVQAYNGNFNGNVNSARDVIGVSATEVLVKLNSGREVSVQSFFGGSAEGGELPSGSIIMFDTACPSGWTRFTELDGKVPRGVDSAGSGGNAPGYIAGTDTQNHPISYSYYTGLEYDGDQTFIRDISIGPSSSWPPYINVVWCKKT